MKLLHLAFAGLFATSCAFPISAQAAIQAGDLVKFGNGPGGPGGIFHIDDLNDAPEWNFDTFCVELTEHVAIGGTYAVESIGTITKNDGKSLSAQTAWLYTMFLDQDPVLSGFTFASPTNDNANALQLGIWRGMGYSDSTITTLAGWSSNYINNTLQPMLAPWITAFTAANNQTWAGIGDIRIMNLRTFTGTPGNLVYTGYAQDQLVRIPPPDVQHAPEPGSVLMWIGLAAAAAVTCKLRGARA